MLNSTPKCQDFTDSIPLTTTETKQALRSTPTQPTTVILCCTYSLAHLRLPLYCRGIMRYQNRGRHGTPPKLSIHYLSDPARFCICTLLCSVHRILWHNFPSWTIGTNQYIPIRPKLAHLRGLSQYLTGAELLWTKFPENKMSVPEWVVLHKVTPHFLIDLTHYYIMYPKIC